MTNPSNPTWLERMAELERAATEGPWDSDQDGDVWTESEKEHDPDLHMSLFKSIGTTRKGPDRGDAAFIAASRQFVPKAIECIKELAKMIHTDIYSPDGLKKASDLLAKWGLD